MDPQRAEVITLLIEILDKVTEGRVKVSELSEDSAIMEDLGLYSLDMLELAYELEVRYDVVLKDSDRGSLRTVRDVVDLILTRRREKAAGAAAPAAGTADAAPTAVIDAAAPTTEAPPPG